jgi:hypothetical protein
MQGRPSVPEAEQFYRGKGTEAMNKNQDGSPSTERHEVYSNQIALFWSAHDLRILFKQVIVGPADPTGSDGQPGEWSSQLTKALAEDRAAVTISWLHAKGLAQMLAEAVRSYEKVNGEIGQPACPGAEVPAQSNSRDFTN